MIRVLIADDSRTARALLTGVLSTDPELEVVGEAANGEEAVARVKELRPDVVTMDLQMPRLDGFGAIRRIMAEAPVPVVVVSATLGARDVGASMEAISAGALTALPKPPGPGSPSFAEAARSFTATVKAMAQVKVVGRRVRAPLTAATSHAPERVHALAIGASTGGPGVVRTILARLPADLGFPILLVQHVAPGFVDGFVRWLDGETPLRVVVARHGVRAEPGCVYVAADDAHLRLGQTGTMLLDRSAPVGGFRPSASVLFASIADMLGRHGAAVILTGMGDDGVEGLRRIRQVGGAILAQDEASSVVFGMPAAAVAAGLPDAVLGPDAIADRIAAWSRRSAS